ncbi:MAG TPA: hypothetical protein VF597_01895 [Candidatus Saccharimonadales bacterium]|jgi:hypothetical protein
MTKSRAGSNIVPKLVVGAVFLAPSLVACGGGEEQVAYCVDENDNILDDQDLCDDNDGGGGSGFFFLAGPYSPGLQPGTRLDRSQGTRISPSDPDARAKAGLPKTGKVTTGKAGTYFRPGGFGSFRGSSSS